MIRIIIEAPQGFGKPAIARDIADMMVRTKRVNKSQVQFYDVGDTVSVSDRLKCEIFCIDMEEPIAASVGPAYKGRK